MSTNAGNRRFRQGLSLVEAMVAVFIITAGIVGTFGYRYHAMLQARRATAQNTAAQIAELLCESWRGVKGIETYEPTVYFSPSLISKISNDSDIGLVMSGDFALVGIYSVPLNGVDYYAILSWKDLSSELRAINTTVVWNPRATGQYDYGYNYGNLLNDTSNESFKLTTYVPN